MIRKSHHKLSWQKCAAVCSVPSRLLADWHRAQKEDSPLTDEVVTSRNPWCWECSQTSNLFCISYMSYKLSNRHPHPSSNCLYFIKRCCLYFIKRCCYFRSFFPTELLWLVLPNLYYLLFTWLLLVECLLCSRSWVRLLEIQKWVRQDPRFIRNS